MTTLTTPEALERLADAGFAFAGEHGRAVLDASAHLASRIAELDTLLTDASQRLSNAEAELAAVRVDAERLDWLEANEADVFRTMSSNEFAVQVCDVLHMKAAGYAPTLRAAIDAAREGK